MKKQINMDSVDMLNFAFGRASDDAIREVISVIDSRFNELYDESEQLEKLDVVAELDPEQRSRAKYLEGILDVMTAIENLCYEMIRNNEEADHE